MTALGPAVKMDSSVDRSTAIFRCAVCQATPWQELVKSLPPRPAVATHEYCEDLQEMKKSAGLGCHLCSLLLGAMDIFVELDEAGGSEPQLDDSMPVLLKLTRLEDESAPSLETWDYGKALKSPAPTSIKVSIHVSVGFLAGGNLTLSLKPDPLVTKMTSLQIGPSTTDLVDYWLQDCLDGHKMCDRDNGIRRLPTRVLDVGSAEDEHQLHLLVTDGAYGRYCALSYCWGTTQSLKTTQATLKQHQEAIPTIQLAKTLQDAITIIRNLGIQYLWVDTLCIIQDDTDDWQRESAQMGRIYEDSVVTIAALSASNGDGGCFFDYSKLGIAPCSPFPGAHLVRGEIHGMRRRLINAPLQSRAWTFQESYMPHRILYCEEQMLLWHCQSGYRTEFDPTAFCQIGSARKKILCCRDRSMYFYSHQDWQSLVEEYTKRQMTFDSDKLPAFSGVAEVFGRHLVRQARNPPRDFGRDGYCDESPSDDTKPPSLADKVSQPPSISASDDSTADHDDGQAREPCSPPVNQTHESEPSQDLLHGNFASSRADNDAASNAMRATDEGAPTQNGCLAGYRNRAWSSSESDDEAPSTGEAPAKDETFHPPLTNTPDSASLPFSDSEQDPSSPLEDPISGLEASSQYICGLWLPDLTPSLVWTYPSDNTTYRPLTSHRPPTWSWVSAEGPIRFPFTPSFEEKLFPYAEVLSVSTHVPGINPFGQVRTAKLTLLGPVCPVPFFVDHDANTTSPTELTDRRHAWCFTARKPAGLYLSPTNDDMPYTDPGTVDLDSNALSPHAIALRVCGFRCLLLEPVHAHNSRLSPDTEGNLYRRVGLWSMESVLRKLLTEASGPWMGANVIDAIHEFGDPMHGRHPEELLDQLYEKGRRDVVEASWGIGRWERRVVTII